MRFTVTDIGADFHRGTDHQHIILLQAMVACTIIRRRPNGIDIVKLFFEFAGSLHTFATTLGRIQLLIAIARCAVGYTLHLHADDLRITIGTIRALLLYAHILGVHPFISHFFGKAASLLQFILYNTKMFGWNCGNT